MPKRKQPAKPGGNKEEPKKKKKKSEVENDEEKNTVTVKCALRSKCTSDQIFERIQIDVQEMSKMAIEASRHIHFDLMQKFEKNDFPTQAIDFAKYFKSLCVQKISQHRSNQNFIELRGNRRLYDCGNRSNIREHLITQYKINFINNIKVHAFNRIKTFFFKFGDFDAKDKFHPLKYNDIKSTMQFLFYEETDEIPDPILLELLRKYLDWDGTKLIDLKNDYWKHLKLFYKLQRYNEIKRYKNFKLIPQFHHGAIHIRYDTQGFIELLSKLKILEKPIISEAQKKNPHFKRDYYQQNKRSLWLSHFNPPESNNMEFDYSIATDGVAVSFSMKKLKQKTVEVTNGEHYIGNLSKIKKKLLNGEYDMRCGIDPGRKLMIGRHNRKKKHRWRFDDLKISTAHYHNRSGFQQRYNQLKSWTTEETTTKSPMSAKFINYHKYQQEIFENKQNEFTQRKVTRLKLKKYICVNRTLAKMARDIIGRKTKSALIAIGTTKIPANCPIKGYRRTPNSKLLKALQERADVIQVDEFRTTMLCSKCHDVQYTSKSPNRYQFCPNCRIHWHRDVNAGINILYLAEHIIKGLPIHENFKRSTKLDKIIRCKV